MISAWEFFTRVSAKYRVHFDCSLQHPRHHHDGGTEFLERPLPQFSPIAWIGPRPTMSPWMSSCTVSHFLTRSLLTVNIVLRPDRVPEHRMAVVRGS